MSCAQIWFTTNTTIQIADFPIHVKTEQHAPQSACISHLSQKSLFSREARCAQPKKTKVRLKSYVPKAYKLAKTQRIASSLEIWMSSIFIQSSQWTCSSHTAFLNRPSKQHSSERIKHEFRDRGSHLYTVWVGYCCRGAVISAVQCKQKMKPCSLFLLDGNKTRCLTVCPFTQHRGITFGCLTFPFLGLFTLCLSLNVCFLCLFLS